MKVPNNENAIINRKKITGYLLSHKNPVGKYKAKFFRNMGFNNINLEMILRRHIIDSEFLMKKRNKVW
jgi:hypothetical protein